MNNYKVKESKEFNNYGDEDHFPLQNESPEIVINNSIFVNIL